MTKLENLSKEEFNKLKASGLLKTIYPDAPHNFDDIRGRKPIAKDLDDIDWSSVIGSAQSHIDLIAKEGREGKNDEHYMYEEVMKAVFGKDVFNFINKNI